MQQCVCMCVDICVLSQSGLWSAQRVVVLKLTRVESGCQHTYCCCLLLLCQPTQGVPQDGPELHLGLWLQRAGHSSGSRYVPSPPT